MVEFFRVSASVSSAREMYFDCSYAKVSLTRVRSPKLSRINLVCICFSNSANNYYNNQPTTSMVKRIIANVIPVIFFFSLL